jgi:L-rhamnose mutarotase
MRRIGRVMRVRQGQLEAYRRLHEAVWPEVLAALRRAGIRDYTIYHRGLWLFTTMAYDGADYEADRARLLADPAIERWNALTAPCLEPPDGPDGQPWPVMDELFHMD